ncbi:MAG: penicillin-binding protein 2 [Bacteroidota bacterium]|nr:penicillin-binding protein 2 [Bacteroidota bacterium]|tara:strand:+ start:483 stop:2345 length:1863 start_codon:yes stop_codon:yes gene_type:complete
MRKSLLPILVLSVGIIFIGRLFYLQIYSTDNYDIYEDNAIRKVFTYPKRGYIYDRNKTLLVSNQPSYDVMIIPREVRQLDTLEFCDLLKISKEYFINKYKSTSKYSTRIPSVFLPHLSKEDYGYLSEKIRKYKGFYIQKRNLREYNTTIGANVLGYVAEVNRKNILNDNYYLKGDIIGKQGVEKSYEKYLRGIKGIEFIQKDRFNRDIGRYKEGSMDIASISGKDLTITIDAALQEYGEVLMENKKGAIVAIEPKSGEILSLVSSPSYNPNLLVGRKRSKNYQKLYKDSIHRPLIDKGLLSMFPPGSPFKILVGLTALQEEVINDKSTIFCKGFYIYGKEKRKMDCHCGGGYRNIYNAISLSCNSYFADIYRKTIDSKNYTKPNFDKWSNHIKSFGLGNYLNNDLPVGKKGVVPDSEYYDRWYPDFRWGATTTLSNSIGQGEILTTPIQLANMTAAIANKGHYFTPHIIKNIDGDTIDSRFKRPNKTSIDSIHFDTMSKALYKVYESGTAKLLQIPEIEVCGKSGTSENFTKINGVKTQLSDHSIFVAYAPKENPIIAISVLVENAGYGSVWAGRIASLMIEKYIKEEISLKKIEKLVVNKSFEKEYLKPYLGRPFKINQ